VYEFFFNNMQILHLLYFNNPKRIKSTGPFQVTSEEWEVEENKSFFIGKRKNQGGGGIIVPCVQQMLLKGNFN